MTKSEFVLVKIAIAVAAGVFDVLLIILLIQEPKNIGTYASLIFCVFFNYIAYLLFKKSSSLYKRLHEKPVEED